MWQSTTGVWLCWGHSFNGHIAWARRMQSRFGGSNYRNPFLAAGTIHQLLCIAAVSGDSGTRKNGFCKMRLKNSGLSNACPPCHMVITWTFWGEFYGGGVQVTNFIQPVETIITFLGTGNFITWIKNSFLRIKTIYFQLETGTGLDAEGMGHLEGEEKLNGLMDNTVY